MTKRKPYVDRQADYEWARDAYAAVTARYQARVDAINAAMAADWVSAGGRVGYEPMFTLLQLPAEWRTTVSHYAPWREADQEHEGDAVEQQ